MKTNDPTEQAANFARFASCTAPVHVFVTIYEPGIPKPMGARCRICGGDIARGTANWYARGMAAALRNPGAAKAALPDWLA